MSTLFYTNKERGNSEDRDSALNLEEQSKHQVTQDGSQPSRDQSDCHGGGAEVGGEHLHTQTVQTVEAHGADCSEQAGQHQVHDGAVDNVDDEGGGS